MEIIFPVLATLLIAFAWVPSVGAQCVNGQCPINRVVAVSSPVSASCAPANAVASSCGQAKARVRIFAKLRARRGC